MGIYPIYISSDPDVPADIIRNGTYVIETARSVVIFYVFQWDEPSHVVVIAGAAHGCSRLVRQTSRDLPGSVSVMQDAMHLVSWPIFAICLWGFLKRGNLLFTVEHGCRLRHRYPSILRVR